MTVTTTHFRKVYDGDGSTVAFTINFQFWDVAEIDVKNVIATTGVVTQQILTTHYSVTGGNGSTGLVTFVTAPPSGTEVHIERQSVSTQNVDLSPSQKLPSASIEQGLDRQAMRIQESRSSLERYVGAPVTDEDTDTGYPGMELPNKIDRANKYMGFGADGSVTVTDLVTPNTVTVTAAGAELINDNAVSDMRTTLAVPHNAANADKIQLGTESARAAIAAAAFGDGFFLTTDEHRLWQCNGSSWLEVVIGQYAQASLPSAADAGRLYLDTDTLMLKRDSGAALVEVASPWCYGSIGGLRLGGGGTATLTISAGSCRMGNAANPSLMNATSTTASFTKTLSASGATWSAGTGNPGRPDGVSLTANSWYHVYMIGKNDGTVDFGIDTSDTAGTLLDGSNAGAGSNPFRYYRHLGWIQWNSAGNAIVDFIHRGGDLFSWEDNVEAFSATGQNYTGGAVALDLSPGFPKNVTGNFVYTISSANAATGYWLFSEAQGTSGTTPAGNKMMFIVWSSGVSEGTGSHTMWLSSSTTIKLQATSGADSSVNVNIWAQSWVDTLRSSPL